MPVTEEQEAGRWQIDCEDVLAWCAEYDGPKFHAMLCDPPYHLTQAQVREIGHPSWNQSTRQQRQSKSGFMGKEWDGGGIAFNPATWAALSEHLLPGAFIFVFGSSRGWHRLAVAIEDAGFVFHPSLMVWGWVQGAGFPKATRIDTQIDKHGGASIGWFGPWLREWRTKQGITQKELAKYFPSKTGGLTGCVANWELSFNMPTVEQFNTLCNVLNLPFKNIKEAEREVTGQGATGGAIAWSHGMQNIEDGGDRPTHQGQWDITTPATDLARAWEGHRYGRQALKPAVEMIICAQKPYEGRPVDSIVETGSGALFIDGGRVAGDWSTWRKSDGTISRRGATNPNPMSWDDGDKRKATEQHPQGRWPPNFCLIHVPPRLCATCDGDGCDECNDTGLVGGCRRVGTKRVKGGNCDASGIPKTRIWSDDGGWKERIPGGYADADGYEETAVWQCVESCAARRIGEQSGVSKDGTAVRHNIGHSAQANIQYAQGSKDAQMREDITYGGQGTVSRFFPQFGWAAEIAERLANSDQVRYEPKAPRTQRNAGLAEAGLVMPRQDLTEEQKLWLYAELEKRGVSVT